MNSALKNQTGFTLIELMIVVAIIAILTSIALPAYETYSSRAKFSEVVLATDSYRSAAETAVQTGRVTAVGQLNSGSYGIPAVDAGIVGEYIETIGMAGGTITAVSTNLPTNATFVIQGSIVNGGIAWTESGTCRAIGLC